jgi:hypothetical protein
MGVMAGQGAPNPNPTLGWPTNGSVSPLVTKIFTPKSALYYEALLLPCAGFSSVSVFVWPTTSTASSYVPQVSMDGNMWCAAPSVLLNSGQSLASNSATQSGSSVVTQSGAWSLAAAPSLYQVAIGGFNFFRLVCTAAPSTGTSVTFQAQASTAPSPFVTFVPTETAANINQYGGNAISAINFALQASQVSGTTNATTTRTATSALSSYKSLAILLNITSAGAATGTLQIYIEDSFDGGTTYQDLVSSNTFTFGAAITTQLFYVNGYGTPAVITTATSTNLTQGAAAAIESMAAGSARQGPWGDRVRVREVVSGVSGSPTGVTYTINAVGRF